VNEPKEECSKRRLADFNDFVESAGPAALTDPETFVKDCEERVRLTGRLILESELRRVERRCGPRDKWAEG
jgi:hypothetical protein